MKGDFATCRNTNAHREVNCIFKAEENIHTGVGGIYIALDQICVLYPKFKTSAQHTAFLHRVLVFWNSRKERSVAAENEHTRKK